MTVSKPTSIMGTLDLRDSMHSSRHHRQRPAESPAEDSTRESPDSYGDFFPHLHIRVIPDPVEAGSQEHDITPAPAAARDPLDNVYPAGPPLTPAALAALGESRGSRFESWLEAVQYNNRVVVEGASASAGGDDVAPPIGADELIAVGEWCPIDILEYPVMLQPDDILEEEDAMSDWVEITHDEV